jgi:hypothetical protein
MEAADLLGVSPQCLARLIDRREISCRAADGSVLLHDVLEYKRCRDRDRRAFLDNFTAESAEAGLYD